jgi:hypothetical protein
MVRVEPLVEAALQRDNLRLRSLAQDLLRSDIRLAQVPRPRTDDQRVLAIAAALLELLAERSGQPAPAWTSNVGAIPEPMFLLEAATRMKRLRTLCETSSPMPLKKRQLYAPPDFLKFV